MITPELTRDEYTEYVFDAACFGEPVDPDGPEDVVEGIERAMALDERPVFLEGLSERLEDLGVACSPDDTNIILSEVRQRYKTVLDKPCPRTVQEWIRGTTPGITNRINNYDLCFALEMDYRQTAFFFQKHYLTIPFNVKSRVDAVFMYALYHKKPYLTVRAMLEDAKGFVPREKAHTSTSQIAAMIFDIDDDERFLQYLSEHCYNNEQQFRLARSICNDEIGKVRDHLLKYESNRIMFPDRLNSLTVEELLGYKYQSRNKSVKANSLPKRFLSSLPNDVTLGKIINSETVSYELLRKTLMLLKFYNFYNKADNNDKNSIGSNLMDFYEELDATLISCGFAQLYVRHPFDCLLLYCANSFDPIYTLNCVMSNERN